MYEQPQRWTASNIKAYRKGLRISQKLMGVLIGVRQDTISFWELGKAHPGPGTSMLLDQFFRKEYLVREVNRRSAAGGRKNAVQAANDLEKERRQYWAAKKIKVLEEQENKPQHQETGDDLY